MSLRVLRHLTQKVVFDRNLKEIKKHGSEDFPLVFYKGSFLGFNTYGTHWHEEMEIIVVTSGSMTVQINHVDFFLNKGDIAIIQNGYLHSIEKNNQSKESVTFDTLIFSLNMLQSVITDYTQRNVISKIEEGSIDLIKVITPNFECYHEFIHVFNQMQTAFNNRFLYYQVYIKGLLYMLIFGIIKCGYQDIVGKGSKTKTSISKAIDTIITNLADPIKISDLAGSVGYTESYFMRAFKDNTGYTVSTYINERRIEQAKIQLSSTSIKVSEIAISCGFSNLGYFNKIFKNVTKMTPSAYRKSFFKTNHL